MAEMYTENCPDSQRIVAEVEQGSVNSQYIRQHTSAHSVHTSAYVSTSRGWARLSELSASGAPRQLSCKPPRSVNLDRISVHCGSDWVESALAISQHSRESPCSVTQSVRQCVIAVLVVRHIFVFQAGSMSGGVSVRAAGCGDTPWMYISQYFIPCMYACKAGNS